VQGQLSQSTLARQRSWLKGSVSKVLAQACCAFSPDTILRWHHKLIAMKYGHALTVLAGQGLQIGGDFDIKGEE
jgi:hypothetical protein